MTIISNKDGILKLSHPGKEDDLFVALSECPNPYCDCGESLILVTETGADFDTIASPESKIILELDVHQNLIRQIDNPGEEWYDENDSKKLKNFLDENLTQEDWFKLQYHYYFKKNILIESEPEDHEYKYEFPVEHMNDESLLIRFDAIYKASETFTIENDGIVYDVIEQYCKNPDCKCTDINIHLFKEGKYHLDFDYNYKTKKLRNSKFKWVIQKLEDKYEDIYFKFEFRNTKIKLLYSEKLIEKATLEYDKLNAGIAPSLKTGRNEKCPCGSGKKYKHCCMNKLSFQLPKP